MSYGRGPTLELYLAIVIGVFATLIGSVWLRTAHPKLARSIWYGFLGLIDYGLRTTYEFSHTQLGFYIGVIIIYGTLAFFAIGIVVIVYETIFETP